MKPAVAISANAEWRAALDLLSMPAVNSSPMGEWFQHDETVFFMVAGVKSQQQRLPNMSSITFIPICYKSLKFLCMKKLIENSPSQNILIQPFQPEDQDEVRKLVLAGLAEHWGTLDPGKNPDLNDISRTYVNAVFLVAKLNNQIVGTGAFIPKSDDTAEIVRMSVATHMRRKGIGGKILQSLCEHARSNGYKRLVLETTETWQEVIEFYKRFGFHITHYLDGDVYFALEIPEASN